MLISLSWALTPQMVRPLRSVTHGQCNARPTFCLPVISTEVYCSVSELLHSCAPTWSQTCDLLIAWSMPTPLGRNATLKTDIVQWWNWGCLRWHWKQHQHWWYFLFWEFKIQGLFEDLSTTTMHILRHSSTLLVKSTYIKILYNNATDSLP